jgi:type VI protein secretion system component Hcp
VASIRLLKALLQGRIIAKVILDFGQGPDGKSQVTYRITLLNVIVVGLNETSAADGTPLDEVQLSFDSANWEVFDPSDSTGFDGATGRVNVTAPTGNRGSR